LYTHHVGINHVTWEHGVSYVGHFRSFVCDFILITIQNKKNIIPNTLRNLADIICRLAKRQAIKNANKIGIYKSCVHSARMEKRGPGKIGLQIPYEP